MTMTPHKTPDFILWDIVEEHLDEAEFLFDRWNRALFQPIFNLAELAKTFEPRLFAHVDALLIGGPEIARSVLLPALLSAETPARATVAALTLLADTDSAWVDPVIHSMLQAKAPFQDALVRALILSDFPSLDAAVLRYFRANPENAYILQILVGRGVDPGSFLRVPLESRDPSVVAIARHAVQRFGRREFYYLGGINSRTGSPPPCHELEAKLHSPETVEPALWNLGFCGTIEAGDLCVTYLSHSNERIRKLAAASLAWIGGFNPAGSQFHLSAKDVVEKESVTLPDFEDDDLAANLELDGVDSLSPPNADAIAHWWQQNRDHMTEHRRCLLGRPFYPETVAFALREGPLWRRHQLAVELCARTDGRKHVSTDAFSSRQLQQIAAAF